MPLTLTQTDIANLALMRLGQRKIQSISDPTDPNAIACDVAWLSALGEVGRETPWNCLKARQALNQLAPAPGSPATNPLFPPTATQWAPAQNYAVNAYVTFGFPAYLYQCLIANTSGSSFTIDLTKGFWFQTDLFSPNYLNQPGNASPLYEWPYAFGLPTDFLLLTELNGQNCWWNRGNTYGSLYEVYQKTLYCRAPTADIKYNQLQTDTSCYDSLFIRALECKIAELIATTVRKDDASLSLKMRGLYMQSIARARVQNAAESNPRRYSLVSQSRFVSSRYNSTNG
jgi:hypothetical protein